MNKVLIIIPTYNEKENIKRIIDKVFSVSKEVDILVVDDNSPDGTSEIVESIIEKDKRVHILKRDGKLGLGTAYIAGFKYALKHNFDIIFEMDADFSHDPAEIPNFLEAIKENDLILGSRYVSGVNVINWPLRRLILSYGANVYTRVITGMPVKDATGGFKAFRRTVLEAINLDRVRSNGYSFQIEMTFKAFKKGFKIKEIPIIFVDRLRGNSKMSTNIIREAIFMVWKLKFKSIFNLLK